jgi:hypothetical protein
MLIDDRMDDCWHGRMPAEVLACSSAMLIRGDALTINMPHASTPKIRIIQLCCREEDEQFNVWAALLERNP